MNGCEILQMVGLFRLTSCLCGRAPEEGAVKQRLLDVWSQGTLHVDVEVLDGRLVEVQIVCGTECCGRQRWIAQAVESCRRCSSCHVTGGLDSETDAPTNHTLVYAGVGLRFSLSSLGLGPIRSAVFRTKTEFHANQILPH